MATDSSATAHVTFPDGEIVAFTVRGKSSYPDVLAQLRAETVNGFRDILRMARVDVPEEVDPLAEYEDQADDK